MNRRFAPHTVSTTLASRLTTQRLPLDLALSLCVEIVEAVATAHQQRRTFGRLSPADLVVGRDGTIAITAPALEGADPATDTFAVGAVLYQLFTGLTPNQARAHLAVSPLHDAPPASRINPGVDETIEALLSLMLDRDPSRRPHSLRVIEGMLADVCESLELEPSRASILRWASLAPVPVLRKPSFVVVLEVDEEEGEVEEDSAPAPLRFDAWAAAACAFFFVAFAMATQL